MNASRRVVIVSGGSRGLGQAIVSDLLASQSIAATFSRSSTPFVDEQRAADPHADSFFWKAVDGSDTRQLEDFVRTVFQRYGRLDALVNNMGAVTEGMFTLQRDEDIRHQIAVNLESVIFLTRACLKCMLTQSGGTIVNIASVNALRGHAGVAVYSATKAALVGLTRSLAVELGPAGIRVNCVAPGFFESEMTRFMSDDIKTRIVRRTPLRRLGTAADVAGAVRFLLSPDAAFITGQVIAVDGGFSC